MRWWRILSALTRLAYLIILLLYISFLIVALLFVYIFFLRIKISPYPFTEKSDPEKPSSTKTEESAMVRDNIESLDDGADEKMLNPIADREGLTKKEAEIKFITGKKNGDAKIDIEISDKTQFNALSKDELMRYVNDPFWVRLRWTLFILFWALWIGMLASAIVIIIHAPKCESPEPHMWYKQGPMIAFDGGLTELTDEQLNKTKDYGATGVIMKLPADETYTLGDLIHLELVKKISDQVEKKGLQLALDVTPNFVNANDPLFKEALDVNPAARSAFVFTETKPPNWVSLENKPAFEEIKTGLNVLSQFGAKRYDLRMDDPVVKTKFKDVLKQLVDSGVKGFRLENTRHFLIDSELQDDAIDRDALNAAQGEYRFYKHTHTTFRDGLGPLLDEYRAYVHNITNGEGFLASLDDIIYPEVYMSGDNLGVDIPHFGRLDYLLREDQDVQQLAKELNANYEKVKDVHGWIQIPFNTADAKTIGASEYAIFTFLLPGVPIATLDALHAVNGTVIQELEKIRESPSCMHGTFKAYADPLNNTIAYTR